MPAVVAVLNKRRADGLGTATHAFACRDHWLRAVYKRVSEACGIPYGQRVEGAWTIHDLRHTALTHLLGNNVDLATVSKQWADHYSLAETTRYLHPTQRSKALATAASNTYGRTRQPARSEYSSRRVATVTIPHPERIRKLRSRR